MLCFLGTIEDFTNGEELEDYINDLVDIYDLVNPIEDDAHMEEHNDVFHDVDDDSDEEDLGSNQDYCIFHDMNEALEDKVLEPQAQVEDEVQEPQSISNSTRGKKIYKITNAYYEVSSKWICSTFRCWWAKLLWRGS